MTIARAMAYAALAAVAAACQSGAPERSPTRDAAVTGGSGGTAPDAGGEAGTTGTAGDSGTGTTGASGTTGVAGTTGASLRAGIPQIVVAFLGDQFFWGLQVEKRGVGPKRIPHKRLTAAKLATAISTALNDAAIRQRARALGEQVRAEKGLARAADIIENTAKT